MHETCTYLYKTPNPEHLVTKTFITDCEKTLKLRISLTATSQLVTTINQSQGGKKLKNRCDKSKEKLSSRTITAHVGLKQYFAFLELWCEKCYQDFWDGGEGGWT